VTPERRRSLLLATLGCALLEGAELPMLTPLRSWLSTWSGLGAIVDGMIRQDYDLELTRYDERGWRATFYTIGLAPLADGRHRDRVRADALARRAGRGVGNAQKAE
jgi:hypothetical protein